MISLIGTAISFGLTYLAISKSHLIFTISEFLTKSVI